LLLLAEFESRGAASPVAIGLVREAVNAERLQRRHDMLEEITPSRLDQLSKRLVDVTAPEARRGSPADTVAEAAAQSRTRARRLRTAIERAGGLYLAERLHRVRIEAKKLRYALEIQRELTRSRSRAHVNRLKTQQDLLGRMHDLEILIDRTRGVQESLPARNRRGMAELDSLIRVLEDECREGHAVYVHARPSLLKLCESVINTAAQSRTTAA